MNQKDIDAVLNGCPGETGPRVRQLCCGQGFCSGEYPVTIAGKAFCFTGRSARASREAMAQAATQLGGTFQPDVTRAADYLVVCGEGSPYWKSGSYGDKIRHAIRLHGRGGKVRIVSEEDFWKACEKEKEETK